MVGSKFIYKNLNFILFYFDRIEQEEYINVRIEFDIVVCKVIKLVIFEYSLYL